ncbi:MAG: hypothetical protein R6U78_04890 [Bacteroidales bacterium]
MSTRIEEFGAPILWLNSGLNRLSSTWLKMFTKHIMPGLFIVVLLIGGTFEHPGDTGEYVELLLFFGWPEHMESD